MYSQPTNVPASSVGQSSQWRHWHHTLADSTPARAKIVIIFLLL